MNLSPVKDVPLKKIIGPGDIGKRQKTPNVQNLAESIRKKGRLLHPLTLRKGKKGLEIVSGRDRYSAYLLAKAKVAPAQIVIEATPLELLEIEIEENLHRRHDDKDALTRQLVDRAAALLVGSELSDKLPHNSSSAGRPKSERTKAREVVAEVSRRSPEAVRKVDERAARTPCEHVWEPLHNPATLGCSTCGATKDAPAPVIELHGRVMPERYGNAAALVHGSLLKVIKALDAARAALDELQGARGPTETWRPAEWRKMLAQLVSLKGTATRLLPAHACVCCDDNEGGCSLCRDERTLTQEEWEKLPPHEREPEAHEAGVNAGDEVPRLARPRREMSVQIGDAPARPISDLVVEMDDAEAEIPR